MNLNGYLIFHANPDITRDTMCFIYDHGVDDTSSLAVLFEDGQYDPVALLRPDATVADMIRLTNNGVIKDNWTENDGVLAIGRNPAGETGKRSTSVGDIVIDLNEHQAFAFNGMNLTQVDVLPEVVTEQISRAKNQITMDRHAENKLGKNLSL